MKNYLFILIIILIILFIIFKNYKQEKQDLLIINNHFKDDKHFEEGPYRTYKYQPPENIFENIGFVFRDNKRYDLYGRETFFGSKKFEYYVNDENKIKIPISIKKNQECSPCKKEVEDDQTIYINSMEPDDYTVKLYNYKF